MLDKNTAKFRVTVINADGLGGSEKYYRYEEMASLKVEGPENKNSNAGSIILGILGVAALVFLVTSADSEAVCAPTPGERP